MVTGNAVISTICVPCRSIASQFYPLNNDGHVVNEKAVELQVEKTADTHTNTRHKCALLLKSFFSTILLPVSIRIMALTVSES